MNNALLTTIGLLANSVVFGAPLWVFFLQSPALFSFMGRSKFLPPMMRLTRLLFRWTLVVASTIVLATELLKNNALETSNGSKPGPPPSTRFAALALVAALINAVVIVPKALAAGAKATIKKDDDVGERAAPKHMAISGGDPTEKSGTKTLHQTVVLFVVVMFVGSGGYVYSIVSDNQE